jgi:hypothetical protein
MKIEQAEYLAASLVDSKAASGEPWTIEERARVRADEGWATKLAKEAVDLLASASGGSSIYKHEPIQPILRDNHAISVHPMFSPDSNTETLGRMCVIGASAWCSHDLPDAASASWTSRSARCCRSSAGASGGEPRCVKRGAR